MAAKATAGRSPLAAEEARLARAAGAGDAAAFAALYERYERRAYNLAYRLCGSEYDAAEAVQEAFVGMMERLPKLADRSLDFGAYLFASTRNACFDLIRVRTRTQPSDAIPESAAPLGSGAGGLGLDPGAPEEDPDRSQLLAAQQEEIREANMRLPEHQREVLALRELEELSYEEIAAIMEMNRNSVAQLISRARIKLRDELRGSALTSIVARSKDCERALPLIAMRDDGQLDEGSADAIWLDRHLRECDRCRVGREAMLEAGVSYRAWVPLALAPWLLKATMAKAAERTGADWSTAIATARSSRPDPASLPGMPAGYRSNGGHGSPPPRPRAPSGATIVAGVAALTMVVVGVLAAPANNNSEPLRVGQSVAGLTSPGAAAANGGLGASRTAVVAGAPAAGRLSGFTSPALSPLPEGTAPVGGAGGEAAARGAGGPPGAGGARRVPDLGPSGAAGQAPPGRSEPTPTRGPATLPPFGSQPPGEMTVPDQPSTDEAPEGEASGEEQPEEPPEEEGVSAFAAGSWQSLALLPEATEGPSTANVGNVIVAAYGFTASHGDSNQTLIYNIAHHSWSVGPPAPEPASSEGIAVSHGGAIYALGGRNGAGDDNNRFTPADETWASLAPMPTGRNGLGAAVVGDSIYAIGGRPETFGPCSGTSQFATVERYDIALNAWTEVAPLPAPRSDVGAIAQGGKVYVFGGCNLDTPTVTNEVDIYDPRTNTWSSGAPLPTPRAGFYGIGIKGDRIYVIGGLDASGLPSPADEVYNIAHNSWSQAAPLPNPRGEMGVASHGGRIYMLGGGIPAYGSPQSTNEAFKP